MSANEHQQRNVERKRAGEHLVAHQQYAEREDAECMAELPAVGPPPVSETATTVTAILQPKPRKSAVASNY
jgi:hypothetical protein